MTKVSYQHKELAQGKWFKLSFFEQMANIGSEVERAISWKNKNLDYSKKINKQCIGTFIIYN